MIGHAKRLLGSVLWTAQDMNHAEKFEIVYLVLNKVYLRRTAAILLHNHQCYVMRNISHRGSMCKVVKSYKIMQACLDYFGCRILPRRGDL